MPPVFRKYGAAIISLVTAVAIIVSALLAKDTAYENVWLIIFAVGMILAPAFEYYAKRGERKKR